MERTLAATNTKTLTVLFTLSTAALVYILSSELLSLDMSNVMVFMLLLLILVMVSSGKEILTAKKVVVTQSHAVIQSQLFPWKKVSLPLNDLMVAKTGRLSFLGHTSLRFAASVSGDEVETNKQLAQSILDVRDTFHQPPQSAENSKLNATQQKEAMQQLLDTYKALTIRAQTSFVSKVEAQQAAQFLDQYVQQNMHQN